MTRTAFRERLSRFGGDLKLAPHPMVERAFLSPVRNALTPILRPYRRLRRITGQGSGGALSLSFFGGSKSELIFPRKCFFTDCTVEDTKMNVPFWKLSREAPREESDLIIVRSGRRLVQHMARPRALILPARVDAVLDLDGTWDEIRSRFRKSAKAVVRVAKRHTYTHRISSDPADLVRFYRETYQPTIRGRHGALANPLSMKDAEVYLRHGFVFFLSEQGREIAAGLCMISGKTLKLVADGVSQGNPDLVRSGAVGSLHLERLQWALAHGYEKVSFMSSAPCRTDSVLRSKLRWGSRVAAGPGGSRNHLWLYLRRRTPAVSRCLQENPLIVLDGRGQLATLVVIEHRSKLDDNLRRSLLSRHRARGIPSVLVCTVDDLFEQKNPLQGAERL